VISTSVVPSARQFLASFASPQPDIAALGLDTPLLGDGAGRDGRPLLALAALRAAKAIYFGTLFNCVVVAWVLFAAKAIAQPFLLWDRWLPAALHGPIFELVSWVGVPQAIDVAGDRIGRHSAWAPSR